MRRCTHYHNGVYNSAPGAIKDNKVYFQGKTDQLSLPEDMLMAREECEGGLIQFELDGKGGIINRENKTRLPFQWDH